MMKKIKAKTELNKSKGETIDRIATILIFIAKEIRHRELENKTNNNLNLKNYADNENIKSNH